MWLITFLFIYIFGGITFIPGLIILVLYLHPIYKNDKQDREETKPLKAGEIEESNQSGLESYKAGWIFVTRDYIDSPDQINSNTQPITESNDNKSAYSSLYKLVSDDATTSMLSNNSQSTDVDDLSINESKETLVQPAAPPTSSATTTTTTQQNIRSSQRRHRYYAVLKHGNLFLYKDETLKDVKHVIVLSSYFVTIYPRELSDAQFFTKYSAIALINPNKLILTNDVDTATPPKGSFFIYCDINSDKEDWYFALIRATKHNSELPDSLNPSTFAKTLHFNTKDMINLIQTLYSSEGQLQTKWLNAIIGRLFLGLNGTKVMEDYIRTKLSKKLNKIKTPGFLDKFQIKEISPSHSAPFITYPNLQEINPDGTIVVSAYVSYTGGLSVTISTKVNINLGAKFTNREVDILLRVTLNRFEGPILIKIKPQPSARVWYTYKTEPIMNINIEPVISARQVSYNIVTNYMEKKLKEAIRDSLVLPHWDDIVFFETTEELYRGGIWDPAASAPSPPETPTEQSSESTPSRSEEASIDRDLDDDVETRSELSAKLANQKMKLTNTLTDISKRMKKKASSSNVNVISSEESQTTTAVRASPALNTLKKIGKWYFKDEKQQRDESYTPPEMISNRRPPRKSSSVSTTTPPNGFDSKFTEHPSPSYDFGKLNHERDVHSLTTSSWPDNISVMSGDEVSIKSGLLVSEPTVGLTQPLTPRSHKSIRKPPSSPPPPLPEDLSKEATSKCEDVPTTIEDITIPRSEDISSPQTINGQPLVPSESNGKSSPITNNTI